MEGVQASKETVRSLRRLATDFSCVSDSLESEEAARSFRRVTNPTTLTGTIRKAGIAMVVAPEPLTTVAGIALVGASVPMKRREPASLATLKEETARILLRLKSLKADVESLSF